MPQRPVRFLTPTGGNLLQILQARSNQPQASPRRPRICYIPTDLPSPVAPLVCGEFGPDAPPAAVFAQQGISGYFWLAAAPLPGLPGYAIQVRCVPASRGDYLIDEHQLGCLTVMVDGFPTETQLHLELLSLDTEADRVNLRLPTAVAPTTHEVRLTPATYRVGLHMQAGPDGAYFAQRIRKLEAGSRAHVQFGSRFTARVTVLRWDRRYLSLWFDVADDQGNYLFGMNGRSTLRLTQGGKVVFDSQIETAGGRRVEIRRDWGANWRDTPVEYDYTLSSKLVGTLTARGTLPQRHTIEDDLRLAYTSEHFEIFTREPTQNAERIAPVLERAFTWLGTHYAGFVRTTHGGRFRVKCISPFGGAWSSGNVIGLDIYSAHWFAPDRFNEAVDVLYHEFGHCYEGSPPHGALRAPAWGSSIAESQANTLMISCLRACFGDRAYHWYRQKMNSQFFRNSPAETFDRQPVIFGYIDQRYGWQVNRDFFRAIYGREGNCKELVESMDFLSTEQERTAAVYSFLSRSNLAWLYRWAGYGVTDSTIDRALAYFREHKAGAPTDSGNAGE